MEEEGISQFRGSGTKSPKRDKQQVSVRGCKCVQVCTGKGG